MQRLKVFTVLLAVCFLVGCSGSSRYLFYPSKHYYQAPEQLGVQVDYIELDTPDGHRLYNWLISKPGDIRGTVLFLHGNGQNISTHINSIAWLTNYGYEVFLLDYRGYGKSEGEPDLPGVLVDTETAHRWLLNRGNKRPIFIYGQSLGGAVGIAYASRQDERVKTVTALMSESAPASWPQVGREVLSQNFITWLFQWVAYILPSEFDAEDAITELTDIPVLLMHSPDDPVVLFHHSEQLRERAPHAHWYETKGPHIAGLADVKARQAMLDFMEASIREAY